MTLHGAARDQVEAGEADRRSGRAANRAATAQRAAEAEERRDTGFLVPIETGVTVRTDPTKLRGPDNEVSQQDGTMTGIALDSYAYGNDEGHFHIVWRVFNPHAPRSGKRFSRWLEDVLDPWATERTDPHLLARYWRQMLGILVEGSGLPTSQEAQIAEDAHRVQRVLIEQGGRI
jgi:hypothetical protein